MADISTWSPVDESNTAAPPAGAPEGMAPSGVNNTMRAIMGAVRRFYDTVTAQITNLTTNAVLKTGSTMTGTLSVPQYNLGATVFANRGAGGETLVHDAGGGIALLMTATGTAYRANTHLFETDAEVDIVSIGSTGMSVVGAVNVSGAINVAGTVSANNFVPTSDRRSKTEIGPSARGLAEILELLPAEFCRIATPGRRELGLVAQDVERVLPEAVFGTGSLGVDYAAVVTCLVAAVQQLHARVVALEGGER